ncbi:bZIP transcription factor 53-like [Zingiber officinale]|uniref:bZIP transcription factor 53-like n=1 Tax=Zingiber officinale TaxID=94328 RepID=UPI001C4C8600|nr:bZIP transcription factor 53-like [Zingiber officinale]
MPCSPVHQDFSSGDSSMQRAIDERKRKKMLSNRESARRSRMRKQQKLDDMLKESADFKGQNSKIEMQINVVTQHFETVDTENTILRAQISELTARLQSMNSILHIYKEVSGLSMEIPEMPETMTKPWRLPFQAQPLSTAVNMFKV